MKKLIITTVALAALTFGACKKDNLQPATNTSSKIEQLNNQTLESEQEINDDKATVALIYKLLKIDKQKTKTVLNFSHIGTIDSSRFSLQNCPYIMKFTDGSTKIVSTYFGLRKQPSSSTQKIEFYLYDFSTGIGGAAVSNYAGFNDKSHWANWVLYLSKTGTNTFSAEFIKQSFANSVATNEAKYNVSLVLNPTTKKVTVTIKLKDLIPNNALNYINSTRTFAYYVK